MQLLVISSKVTANDLVVHQFRQFSRAPSPVFIEFLTCIAEIPNNLIWGKYGVNVPSISPWYSAVVVVRTLTSPRQWQ